MVFDKQEKLAYLRQEYSQLSTEKEYFDQYAEKTDVDNVSIKFKRKLSSKHWMMLWQEYQLILEKKKAISVPFKIKALFKYGITDWDFYKQEFTRIITTLQTMYYHTKQAELSAEIEKIENTT